MMDFARMSIGQSTSLRALLDNPVYCANMAATGQANLNALNQQPKDKIQLVNSPEPLTYHPSVANLMKDVQSSIWGDQSIDFNIDALGNNGEPGFDLEECMDLDEYLTELTSTNVTLSNQNSPVQVSPEPSRETPTDMPTVDMAEVTNQITEKKLPSVNKPIAIENKVVDKPTESLQKTEEKKIDIVKKRRFEQDGEGLGDASVIVVPGQDGFDPQTAKFKPEELQPQPIIKKSRKILVPENCKDDKYWRRRNKNNVAAKRSREARRAKENQIILRAKFLESEHVRLSGEMEQMAIENNRLKQLLLDHNISH